MGQHTHVTRISQVRSSRATRMRGTISALYAYTSAALCREGLAASRYVIQA